MREIKFRVWDGERMHSDWDAVSIYSEARVSEALRVGYSVMQFTGLHDADGREIYEGDIVEGKKGYWAQDVTGVVEYQCMAFMFVGETASGTKWLDTVTNPDCKQHEALRVVGNIYENELEPA